MENLEERLEKIRTIAKKAGDLYEERLKITLDDKITSLEKILKEFVDNHAKDFGLIYSNDSSKEIKLYEITKRVKTKDSLIEKIVRNQEFYEMAEPEQDIMVSILQCNDDLMGLRFLVSLSCDCKALFGVFEQFFNELNDNSIEIFNLKENPQIMKNGRDIYRIKGSYESYPFELQIKSKVDSAWADIEHMLFYKDYRFSYIQNTNRNVMNKVGDLLEQIDKLMVQIRESQSKYELERRELEFNQYIGNRYMGMIKEKLISVHVLRENRDILFDIYRDFTTSERDQIDSRIKDVYPNPGFMELEVDFGEKQIVCFKNYHKMKNYSIELVIFEHIYEDWLWATTEWKRDGKKPMTQGQFEKYLHRIFTFTLKSKLTSMLAQKGFTDDEINNYSETIADTIIELIKKKEIFVKAPIFLFDKDVLFMFFCFYKIVREKSIDLDPELDAIEIELVNEMIDAVLMYLFSDKCVEDIEKSIRLIKEKSDHNVIRYLLSFDFCNEVFDVYRKRGKTESGKVLKDNKIIEVIENAIKEIEK